MTLRPPASAAVALSSRSDAECMPTATKTNAPLATEAPQCEICAFAKIHHWWGPGLKPARSHCSTCHRSWTSLAEGHCPQCCRHFAKYAAFDAHLDEDAHCIDPETITRADGRPRFAKKVSAWGTTWKIAFYGQRPDFGSDDEDEDNSEADDD